MGGYQFFSFSGAFQFMHTYIAYFVCVGGGYFCSNHYSNVCTYVNSSQCSSPSCLSPVNLHVSQINVDHCKKTSAFVKGIASLSLLFSFRKILIVDFCFVSVREYSTLFEIIQAINIH